MVAVAVDPYAAFSLRAKQREAVEFLEQRNGCAGLFLEARVGKTRAALAYLVGRAERVLVIGKTDFLSVWQRELSNVPAIKQYYGGILMLAGVGTAAWKAQRVKQLTAARAHWPRGIVAVNYESYWREPLRSALVEWEPDAFIPDEAHKLNHPEAKQTRFAHVLSDPPHRSNQKGVAAGFTRWRCLACAESFILPGAATPLRCPKGRHPIRKRIPLTGTPITNGIEDLYSLYRIIDDRVFGRNRGEFERIYIIRGGYEMREIKGYRNEAQAMSLVAQTSFRATRAECFDLPPTENIVIDVELSPTSRRVYNDIKKHSIAQLDDTKGTVIAPITLTAIMRLQQLTSGYTTTDDDRLIDLGNEKLDACETLVSDLIAGGEKVVVFCRFIRDYHRVYDRLANRWGVDRLTGETSRKERRRILPEGKWTSSNFVIVCSIEVGSLGIDLSDCTAAIFYSTGYKLDPFIQSRDRLQGEAQKHSVGYYHLICLNTVDVKVYEALAKKYRIASYITDKGAAKELLA